MKSLVPQGFKIVRRMIHVLPLHYTPTEKNAENAMERLSYSSLTSVRTCPQRFNYQYVQGLEPDKDQGGRVELTFGTWWHALRAVDSIERGHKHGSLVMALVPETIRCCDGGPEVATRHDDGSPVTADLVKKVHTLAANWWEKQTEEVHSAFYDRLGQDLPGRLKAVDTRYRKQWKRARETEHPIAVELWWDQPLVTDNGEKLGTLVGVVDEIYRDTKRNLIVARDHKTHKNLQPATAADDMMDSQLQLYVWGVSPLLEENGVPAVQATAYDRVRTKAPATPQLTKSGTLSKSVTDYDVWTYAAWAMPGVEYPGTRKDGSGAGTYTADPKVIEKLGAQSSRAKWFTRTLTPVSKTLVRAHIAETKDAARMTAGVRRRAKETGSAPRNLTRNTCQFCDFADLCRAQLLGGPGEYDPADFGLRYRNRSTPTTKNTHREDTRK